MKKSLLCLLLSIVVTVTFIPQFSFAAETASNVITGFADMETTEYYYEGNPEEDELTLNLPETIKVNLGGSESTTSIKVDWVAVEDFDNTDFYFYSMKPVWDDKYILDTSLSDILDVPWITVYKQEPKNRNIEPIMTEDELDPIYTDAEGPIDPDTASVSDSVADLGDTVKGIIVEDVYAATADNTETIYKYLKNEMGLNTAAACGVMVNINAESGMSPINLQNTYNSSLGLSDSEYTSRVDKGKGAYKTKSGTSKNFKTDSAGYGLCQWTSSGRKTKMLQNAISKDKSIGDLDTQLDFFANEIENSYPNVYKTLKNVPNNATGAYIAAAEMCLAYEIPANTVNTAASRGKTCLSGYWKTYSGSSASVTGKSFASLCGYSYPSSIKTGKGIDVKGYAVSNYKFTSINAKILNSSGNAVYSSTKNPGTTAYKLSNFDSAMKFSKLSAGTYSYVITAKDSLGKTVKATHKFKVSSSGSTQSVLGFATTDNSGSSSDESDAKKDTDGKTYSGTFPKLPSRGYFKRGDKGTQVKYLQKFLNWAGYSVSTGGTYGDKTIAAVKKFQKANGIKQDGKFGKTCLNKAKTIKK